MKSLRCKAGEVLVTIAVGLFASMPAGLRAGPLDNWRLGYLGPPGVEYSAVAFGAGVFVGGPGVLITSSNGVNWATIISPPGGGGTGLSYCNGRFLFSYGGGNAASSVDGTNWN